MSEKAPNGFQLDDRFPSTQRRRADHVLLDGVGRVELADAGDVDFAQPRR
jgi:hypothetical protein